MRLSSRITDAIDGIAEGTGSPTEERSTSTRDVNRARSRLDVPVIEKDSLRRCFPARPGRESPGRVAAKRGVLEPPSVTELS